jgi:hypothetical protein
VLAHTKIIRNWRTRPTLVKNTTTKRMGGKVTPAQTKSLEFVVADLRHLFMHLSIRPDGPHNRHDAGLVGRSIKSLESLLSQKENK